MLDESKVLDEDYKKVLSEIYNKAYNLLLGKAKELNINEKDLIGYFNPTSEEHIEYYNRRYDLAFKKKDIDNKHSKTYGNFLFMRFVSSLFNKGNEYYITNNEMEKQLAESLNKFDLHSFLKYDSFQDYLDVVKNNGKCSALIEKRYSNTKNNTDYLKKLYNSMQDVAAYINKLIKKNKTYQKRATDYKDFENYLKDVKDLISNKEASGIKGMRITLLADAVKESGIIDTVKPDRHIQNIIYQLFGNGEDADIVNDKTYKKVLVLFYDISKASGKSIYQIDKVMYMYCAQGNKGFYMHNTFKSDRDKLVEEIKSIRGISNLKN